MIREPLQWARLPLRFGIAKVHALMASWNEAAGGRGPNHGRFARGGRLLAAAGAFLLLSVQLTVAAHTHPSSLLQRGDACAQLTVDNSLCPLCLLAFHLPVNPVPSAALALPPVEAQTAPVWRKPASRSFVRASCPPRAPPHAA